MQLQWSSYPATTHTCTHTHGTYAHTHMHMHICIRIHRGTYAATNAQMRMHAHIRAEAYMHIYSMCTYACKHTCTRKTCNKHAISAHETWKHRINTYKHININTCIRTHIYSTQAHAHAHMYTHACHIHMIFASTSTCRLTHAYEDIRLDEEVRNHYR